MPTTTFNPTVELLNFEDLLEYAANNLDYAGQTELLNSITAKLRANPYRAGGLTTQEAWANEIAKELRTAGYEIQYNGNGAWTGSAFSTQPTITTMPNPINSNVANVSRGTLRNWYGGLNEVGTGGVQTWVPTRFPVSGGLGSQALYLAGSVASGVAATSTGIWLGKTIDSALYNAFPDFWDSVGMSSLNPETWNSITNGDDSPFAGLFNFILGLDPDTGKAKAYMNENALAYMAYYMKQQGAFSEPLYIVNENPDPTHFTNINIPIYAGNYISWTNTYRGQINVTVYTDETDPNAKFMNFLPLGSSNSDRMFVACTTVEGDHTFREDYYNNGVLNYSRTFKFEFGHRHTYDNKMVRYDAFTHNTYEQIIDCYPRPTATKNNAKNLAQQAWLAVYDSVSSTGVEGIGNQVGATLPDVSDWNDIPSTLQSLQNQYPDSFANPMVWNSDSPTNSETGNLTRYIPVPFPAIDANGNPISDTQTQTSTEISPTDTTKNILDYLLKVIQQTSTDTATDDVTPPLNPTDTGTGNSPIHTPPSGSASALWSVYHPTQAQVNSFGGWLWSNAFLDQLLRVFQNPMDAVISLRKVFITPVDAGQSTIHAGALDSEVPSAIVTQQYVYVDCGYVDCHEQFGNVFDYTNTEISIYLPFIGIEQLNTAEVMRSTLHVVYGMDLFTGVCLATVEVARDGNTVVMYQYSGNASVEYPLSGQRAAGFLSGLMSIGGATALAATGGGSVVAAGMALHGMQQMSTVNVSHSGGFAGNAGAMAGKIPYLIVERPQTKLAKLFPSLSGYPTNVSGKLSEFEGQVVVSDVHVEGMSATDTELSMIEDLLKEGVLI